MKEAGLLLVLSGPSGVGKGTIANCLLEIMPKMSLSVSVTTRRLRKGEAEGVDYHFAPESEFEELIREGKLLEWAKVYGSYYGTRRQFVEDALKKGRDVLLEIDIQGALQVKEKMPEAVLVFVVPPDKKELRRRLEGRATDDQADIEKRLGCFAQEMALAEEYDYIVRNDDYRVAAQNIQWILAAEKMRPRRLEEFLNSFGGST